MLAAIERLSAATAPAGGGADAHADLLVEDFSQWAPGDDVARRKISWVEAVRGWFDDR